MLFQDLSQVVKCGSSWDIYHFWVAEGVLQGQKLNPFLVKLLEKSYSLSALIPHEEERINKQKKCDILIPFRNTNKSCLC